MRAFARAHPSSIGPARRRPSWAGARLHPAYPAAGAARAAAAPLDPAPTGPVGVWRLPAPVAGARSPHMLFPFCYPQVPVPAHYTPMAAPPPAPQPPDLAAGRADGFVASGARGAAAPAASAAPAVKGYCPPGLNDSIDQALAVAEPCAVCQSAAAACVVLHPCGHVLCQACLGKTPTVCPASSCGEALERVQPQWDGSFDRLRTREPHQLHVLGNEDEGG